VDQILGHNKLAHDRFPQVVDEYRGPARVRVLGH
jgi:hypothetical protein